MDNECEEIWRPIDNYESQYEISNFGRIRRISHTITQYSKFGKRYEKFYDNKLLKLSTTSDNYKCVQLSKNGKPKDFFVHRLVALAFIPNPENKPQVNHIDCDPSNNHVNNLEWVTQSENMKWAVKCGAQLGGNRGKHLSDETKEKLRNARLGSHMPESAKKKISDGVRAKAQQISKNNPLRREVHCLEINRDFYSISEAAQYFNCSNTAIGNCLSDGHKLHNMYTFIELMR